MSELTKDIIRKKLDNTFTLAINTISDELAESACGTKKLKEVAPPDMEDWVKANKARFIKEYGKEKGMEVLYATAWKMSDKKSK